MPLFMQSKSNISNLTDEELEAALSGTKIEVKGELKTDIFEFVETFKLESGETRVPSRLIYKIYKRWSKSPLIQTDFGHQLSLMFENKKEHYYLNKDIKDLAKQVLTKAPAKLNKLNSTRFKQHFDNFVTKFNIVRGDFYIKSEVLFDLYDKWTYANKKASAFNPDNFKDFCNLYFKSKQDFESTYFGVNESIINNLSPDQKLNCLSKKAQYNAHKKEENKKKST